MLLLVSMMIISCCRNKACPFGYGLVLSQRTCEGKNVLIALLFEPRNEPLAVHQCALLVKVPVAGLLFARLVQLELSATACARLQAARVTLLLIAGSLVIAFLCCMFSMRGFQVHYVFQCDCVRKLRGRISRPFMPTCCVGLVPSDTASAYSKLESTQLLCMNLFCPCPSLSMLCGSGPCFVERAFVYLWRRLQRPNERDVCFA
jgi:hypothetical protein